MTQTVPSARDVLRQRYRDPAIGEPDQWNPVLHLLHSHHSVRQYLDEPVSDATLRLLVSAAQSAPTSSNLQVWSVIAVRDPQRRARLAELAGGQAHIAQAPVLLVWTADFGRLRQLADARGVPLEGADYLESSYVGFVDAALAAQNAVVAAESLGLGTVFVGALRNRPEEVAALLHLPQQVFAVFGLVVGHPDPAEGAGVKPRLPQRAVLHHETYDAAPQLDAITDYEPRLAEYYADQRQQHSWTARVLARLASGASLSGRHRLREALGERGFRLH
ncbi:NADPH-dependent oxidoreductase [Nocardia sp. alder85J]|uniref:NADPH-dependent oxidoreductase n=1 Tax=Nocardia sp. alder85J TaxID=2862949 RepID=UPI001CD69CE1|nr:NADPH-dependent oxidoreductase [Nocardia sp. alder85J]MCX4092597.1 NADPH-dependent oxidoreductase [Nocardia sp. alder85J]